MLGTDFENGLQFGMAGMFIAHLHRALREEDTDAELVWSNVAILTVRGVRDNVMIEFLKKQRRVLWKVRGVDAMDIAGECIETIERFMNEQLHSRRRIGREHKIVCNCQENPRGCVSKNSVESM